MKRASHFFSTALAAALGLMAPHAGRAQAPKAATQASSTARTFATPDEAADAFVTALRAKDREGFLDVLGQEAATWLFSGDPVADAGDRERFLAAYDEKHALQRREGERAVLVVGNDDWPFPAPIVKGSAGWHFDAAAGREELLNRRIGGNELDTIQTLLAIVDAQREYAAQDADRDGFADYAQRFRSTPGKKDGLYWETSPGEPDSPLGVLAARASLEGYSEQLRSPEQEAYHGYDFRILTAQGKHADGGAYDYMVRGKLLGGFAVVAAPARYGVSGVMTFLVNHEGVVFQKDLGPKTAELVEQMRAFDPDASWKRVQ
ncbi:DUF2950 domain-containing protein [Aggregicoccus sp. 17bor-14]|uniref:DUF2950 domain-containing protein n=1 Tax=Myxococcaceae TaxID=31 RepID=UPI00129C13C0|nr:MULTISPECIES: DUF2950 domain-containing protein [Myxococcaceae]MBF5043109.1 DUF2950 domain-containing protein [Simulacricoccus sp. 17bor-14]MRI88871.1 DUF2950 domain-containing protein [Aggregicoccus sp. 17bor-14]